MKSEAEWKQEIIKTTLKINEEFPELSKYIKEIPMIFSETDDKEINIKNLKEYHNSLQELLSKYSATHGDKK